MYIFQGSFGTVLHTGDCRLTESVVARLRHYLAKLGIERLDLVYLDCTFASYPKVQCVSSHATSRV